MSWHRPTVLAALLGLCGCDDADAEPEPDVDSERFVVPEEGYQPPPEGCDVAPREELPVLPMPIRGGVETFLPGFDANGALAIDYDVIPAPLVTELRVTFRFDDLQPLEGATVESECPESVSTTLLQPADVANEVVAARVWAGSEATGGRFADIFVPVGDQSVDLDVTGIDLASSGADAWYAIYEPGWGEPRIALFEADAEGRTLSVEGLPKGPATIVLLQTDAPKRADDFDVLYGPPGFAADWVVWAKSWHAAIVNRLPSEPLSLREIVPSGERAVIYNLGEEVTLGTEERFVAVASPPSGGDGEVGGPCGSTIELWVNGFANLVVDPEAPSPTTAGPGEAVTHSITCEPGTSNGTVLLSVQSLNGRSANIVASWDEGL